MKKRFYLSALVVGLIVLIGCKKETVETPFNDTFSKPYTTGVIKLAYEKSALISGITILNDTIVEFTSRGRNGSEFDSYGYNKPSTPWAQVLRLNPNDYLNSLGIFFAGTDLNALTLPHKFQYTNPSSYAYINYVLGYKTIVDSVGNVSYIGDTYLGSTMSKNFELTILSKTNNRLQGTFTGEIKKLDGLTIQVTNGLFDIAIVDK